MDIQKIKMCVLNIGYGVFQIRLSSEPMRGNMREQALTSTITALKTARWTAHDDTVTIRYMA